MKKMVLGVVIGMAFLVGLAVRGVGAREGVFELFPVADSSARCYFLSVFQSGRYEINGTCRNLLTPYSAELNRYVLWAVDDKDESVRVGEVKYGKITASVANKFEVLVLTAEERATVRKPSEQVVSRGSWEVVPLAGEVKEEVVPSPSPTPDELTEAIETGTNEERTGIARFMGTVGRVIGIGFLVLLIGVVVMTIITRRKEQV